MIVERGLLDTLPFPLASVLWDYESGGTRRSLDPLFNFLEVSAKFSTVVLLSGLSRDATAFVEARRSWQGRVPPSELMRTPTFGTWARLHAGAAKAIRALAHVDASRVERTFLVDRASRVEVIAGRTVISLFDEAVRYRNEWRGHGSIAGPRELARRRERLEVCAASIAHELGKAFGNWSLVAAHAGTMQDGGYECTADVLVGANPRFAERTFSLLQPVERDHLYLLCETMKEPLKLAPLVHLSHPADTSDPAMYFYDRMDKTGVRWLSYHYEPQPELTGAIPDDLSSFLASLDEGSGAELSAQGSAETDAGAPKVTSTGGSGRALSVDLLRAGLEAMGISVTEANGVDVLSFGPIDVGWMHRLGDEHVLRAAVSIDTVPHLPGALIAEVPLGPGNTPATRTSIRSVKDAVNAYRLLATAVALSSGWELPSRSLDDLLSRGGAILAGAGLPMAGWGMGWKQAPGMPPGDAVWLSVIEAMATRGFRQVGLPARNRLRLKSPNGIGLAFAVDAYGPIIAATVQRSERVAHAVFSQRSSVERVLDRQVAWLDFVSSVEVRERVPVLDGPLDDLDFAAELENRGRDLTGALGTLIGVQSGTTR